LGLKGSNAGVQVPWHRIALFVADDVVPWSNFPLFDETIYDVRILADKGLWNDPVRTSENEQCPVGRLCQRPSQKKLSAGMSLFDQLQVLLAERSSPFNKIINHFIEQCEVRHLVILDGHQPAVNIRLAAGSNRDQLFADALCERLSLGRQLDIMSAIADHLNRRHGGSRADAKRFRQ